MTSNDQITAFVRQQIDEMLAAKYDHGEALETEVTLLNARSALYRSTFSRCRADGGEISRLTVTYLVIDSSVDRRISALAVHSS